MLGLDLGIEGGVLRFFYNDAVVPETRELLSRAQRHLSDVMAKYDDALRRAEEAEKQREEAEARLWDALAEIERLKGR